ncbi:MAG: YihY/virulence factor BrkB family protein [Methylococcaceae bacterium]|nr:YihY/virulence factor BrkB family protein [Prolixibacteraceae bacterium]
MKILKMLKTALIKWWDRDPFREGAIIAYYAIFSLPGLLVLVLVLAGYFFGQEAISGSLNKQISGAIGTDSAEMVQTMIKSSMKNKDSLWASIIGIATIILGATAVFAQFQKSINNIWEVEPSTEKSGIWLFLKSRLFSFGLIITIAFLLLISLVLSSLLSAFSKWIAESWSESLLVLFVVFDAVLSLGIVTVLFAMMFRILPDAKIKWRSVWIGAFITAVLFAIGKYALGLYFGKADPASGYGAAGTIILILLWANYSSMIVFYGAEFTKVYSDEHYGSVAPADHAVKFKMEKKIIES